jgi:hypothetical protein
MLSVVCICILVSTAFAGLGFGIDDASKSGLDLNRGYDINTVTTITGQVTLLQHSGDTVLIEVKSQGEMIGLYVGPGSYWDKSGIQMHLNDEISAKGSKAQGKDGKKYLLTQKIENRTTGTQAVLRNDSGEPAWLGAHMNSMRSGGASGTAGGITGSGGSGSMMKSGGSGGMMRSGGGMMRR